MNQIDEESKLNYTNQIQEEKKRYEFPIADKIISAQVKIQMPKHLSTETFTLGKQSHESS